MLIVPGSSSPLYIVETGVAVRKTGLGEASLELLLHRCTIQRAGQLCNRVCVPPMQAGHCSVPRGRDNRAGRRQAA